MPPSPSRGTHVLFLCTGNYYRSRFAALVFNHLAEERGSVLRADSAGLAPQCASRNPGAISPHVRAALQGRGITEPHPERHPRDVTELDFVQAAVVVALKQAEHEPMLRARFPEHLSRVRYWQVDDVPIAPPELALRLIESNVEALLDELDASRRPPPSRASE